MNTARGSSGQSKDERVTLPPIRDILRDELTSSPESSSRTLGSSFSVPMRSALCDGLSPHMSASNKLAPMSPQQGYGHRLPAREGNWGNLPPSSSRNAVGTPPPMSSRSFSVSSSDPSRRPPPGSLSSHRPEAAVATGRTQPPIDANNYRSNSSSLAYSRSYSDDPNRSHGPSRVSHISNTENERHRRRDSSDSTWSPHPNPSDASSHARTRTHAPAASNALQFQPLPHSQMTAHSSRSRNNASSSSAPVDYQSPFGVLIAEVDPLGPPPTDPQRLAILRTLRASGQQGSFPVNFDDPRNPLHSARYECEYCGKRFTRPSSLKIHIHSHTGEKPFECIHQGCGRRFSVQSNMRRHARVHESGAQATAGESTEEEQEENPRS
ncbi:hypothetical protein M0805_001697 [Coniferiporia weirii]|nr:hypothetical protein M0805_001697 [Coniferiporia weirii]